MCFFFHQSGLISCHPRPHMLFESQALWSIRVLFIFLKKWFAGRNYVFPSVIINNDQRTAQWNVKIASHPPVKSIISKRCQVLSQLRVGLLNFLTKIFKFAVKRVFQAGRVVVHFLIQLAVEKPNPYPPTSQNSTVISIIVSFDKTAGEALLFVSAHEKEKPTRRRRKRMSHRPEGSHVIWAQHHGQRQCKRDANLSTSDTKTVARWEQGVLK